MNYYISDTHYHHRKIIQYENRPFSSIEEMNEAMIQKHNTKVSKGDNVYILGDFAFSTPEQAINILRRLNGQKFLIYGNHDKVVRQNKAVQAEFAWCRDYYVAYEDKVPVILFHYPINVWDRKHHGSYHFYGHVHSPKVGHHVITGELVNAFNVGADVQDFEPKTFKEIINVQPTSN